MLKNILNLEGVKVLSNKQKKSIFGGKEEGGATVCKATCNDGSIVTVASCNPIPTGSCGGTAKGSRSCSCGHPGPFDPPISN
ncbi:hypothetical protein GCM10022271_09300 [Corallibacter vietnamensis]|uniref:Natural product n=1 Tax=Corallibacter vietnamensis TaxID=904130 RepID=A0ABN1H341_9FLAO